MTQLLTNKLLPATIGFDKFFQLMEDIEKTSNKSSTYPPYSIYKESDNMYTIDVAVAGFRRDDLDIESKNGILSISGIYDKPEVEKHYLHRGISTRNFSHTFRLAENTIVRSASLLDGILSVKLENVIPEEKLPKKIPIF